MEFYQKEVHRLKKLLYSNESQISTVIGIRNYIENNYDQDLNLDLIAHMRYVSKFHMIRIFKRYYGFTPHQYLTTIRIQKAKEFLLAGKSVSETCFLCGFESLSSFSGLFKRRTTFSPSAYKRAILEKSV